jgi:hypothetical protein
MILVYFKIIEFINDILKLKLDKLIFLNFSNNILIIQILVIAIEYF